MKSDYVESDKHYNEYVETLRNTGKDHAFEVCRLREEFDGKQNEIRDLQSKIEEQKIQIDHQASEMDQVKAIEFDRKVQGLNDDLVRADKKRKDAQDALSKSCGSWTS